MSARLTTQWFLFTLLLASSEAFAASDLANRINGVVTGGGWLPGLITTALGGWAFHRVMEKWSPIIEGQNVFPNIISIISLVGLSVWWNDMVSWILLNVTP